VVRGGREGKICLHSAEKKSTRLCSNSSTFFPDNCRRGFVVALVETVAVVVGGVDGRAVAAGAVGRELVEHGKGGGHVGRSG
jgi:hypothetical protein